MTFDPQEAERLADQCERYDSLLAEAAAMLRAAVENDKDLRYRLAAQIQSVTSLMERVRELEASNQVLKDGIKVWESLNVEHQARLTAAEKRAERASAVVEAAREAFTPEEMPQQSRLYQALQEYDRG